MNFLDSVIEKAKTNPLEAGVDFCVALMSYSPADPLRQGYSLGSALISAQELLGLDARQTAVVAQKVVEPLVEAARAISLDPEGWDEQSALNSELTVFGFAPAWQS
jgi:hypothetical protein